VVWVLAAVAVAVAYGIQNAIVDSQQDHEDTLTMSAIIGTMVTVLNVVLLLVMEALSRMERHTDEGNLQASFMIKFLVVRFLNTTIFPFLAATPFKRASASFLTTITAILLSEAVLAPLLRLLAPWPWFARRFLAPMEHTQRAMDAYFTGESHPLIFLPA
jgi:hypothetical protein